MKDSKKTGKINEINEDPFGCFSILVKERRSIQ